MKNVVLATILACALIGVGHAEAKTKNHNRPVQMVETAPSRSRATAVTIRLQASRWSRRSVS